MAETSATASTPLHRRGYRRLLTAQGVSSFGDWLATFALMTLVLDISGSAAAVGGVLALRLAPATVAGPLIGLAASRLGRRSLLVRLDVLRAGAALLIPLIRSLWWVYSWTIVLEVAAVIAIAARDASIRDLVDEHDLPSANGLVLAATYGAIPLGAGAFAAIAAGAGALPANLHAAGPFLAFWLDAATFVTSGVIIRRIIEIPDRASGMEADGHHIRLRDAWSVPLVRATLAPVVAASLGIGTLFSLGVGFVRDTLGAGEAQFGTLVVVFGAGAVAGLVLRQKGHLAGVAAVRMGVAAMGAVMVVMAYAGGLGVTLAMAAFFGVGGAYAIVSGLTVLQSDIDGDNRLVALGAFHVAVRVALALGALAAGVAADLLTEQEIMGVGGVRLVLLASGAIVAVSSFVVRGTRTTSG